jgi:hypothetical protein
MAVKKKRVLVCGDSFFTDGRGQFPGLHWTFRLPDNIEVTNVAQGGASNTMILEQFIRHHQDHDTVIFNFTGLWRLEFDATEKTKIHGDKWITSCHQGCLTARQQQLDDDYRAIISVDACIVRECGIMISAIELAKKTASVCYSLGGGRAWMQDFCNDYPGNKMIEQYLKEEMPFNLDEYYRGPDYDRYRHLDERRHWNGGGSHPGFHIHLPEIQQRFADQVASFVDNA